ncbi:hypothetical protein D3C80_669500 [compost metagenome]
MHFGGVLDQGFGFRAAELEGHRGQAAQFHLGVFLDHLVQRQHEEARGIGAGEAVPAGQLHVADEGPVGEHQVLVEVEAAVRSARTARGADHQAQHAVAPAADPVLVGLGEQVVHFIDPLGVELAQGLLAEVAAGIQIGEAAGAIGAVRRRPAEMFAVVAVERRAAAGIGRIEEEVLHVHRDELARILQFVDVRAARHLVVFRFALAALADVLGPAGEVQQARVVAEGEAALGLAPAVAGQSYRAVAPGPGAAAEQLRPVGGGPEPGAVVEVGQLVEHGGEHFAAHRAVDAVGLLPGRAAIREAGQQAPVERQGIEAGGAAVAVLRQLKAPADFHLTIEALGEGRRQRGACLVEQLLAGLALLRGQALGVQHQAQVGLDGGSNQQAAQAEEAQQGVQGSVLDGSEGKDGLGQDLVAGFAGFRELLAQGAERGFQLGATDVAGAGDEAGGVVTGSHHHFHVADRGGGVGGEVEGAVQRADDDVAGRHQGLGLGGAGNEK